MIEGFGQINLNNPQINKTTTANEFIEAVNGSGPRVVIPQNPLQIDTTAFDIRNDNLIIDGSQAYTCLKNPPTNTKPLFNIRANNVMLRHLRVRPGPSAEPSFALDAVNTQWASNIVLDHCSLSWAVDEVLNTWYGSNRITVQWCIISEGLHNSNHTEGPHSMGALFGDGTGHSVSVHHNLFAHNEGRNPRLVINGLADIVENVIYNAGDWPMQFKANVKANVVNNTLKPGPDSKRDCLLYGDGQIYARGNVQPGNLACNQIRLVDKPFDMPADYVPITLTSAQQAYMDVLVGAGATLPFRDSVDKRIVNDVINGTGRIIDHPDEVGGWPVIAEDRPKMVQVVQPVSPPVIEGGTITDVDFIKDTNGYKTVWSVEV